jgi:hypothetical protein
MAREILSYFFILIPIPNFNGLIIIANKYDILGGR